MYAHYEYSLFIKAVVYVIYKLLFIFLIDIGINKIKNDLIKNYYNKHNSWLNNYKSHVMNISNI